jgi:hypothetical protein
MMAPRHLVSRYFATNDGRPQLSRTVRERSNGICQPWLFTVLIMACKLLRQGSFVRQNRNLLVDSKIIVSPRTFGDLRPSSGVLL